MEPMKGPQYGIGDVLKDKKSGSTVEIVDVVKMYRVKFITGWPASSENPAIIGIGYEQNVYPEELEQLNARP